VRGPKLYVEVILCIHYSTFNADRLELGLTFRQGRNLRSTCLAHVTVSLITRRNQSAYTASQPPRTPSDRHPGMKDAATISFDLGPWGRGKTQRDWTGCPGCASIVKQSTCLVVLQPKAARRHWTSHSAISKLGRIRLWTLTRRKQIRAERLCKASHANAGTMPFGASATGHRGEGSPSRADFSPMQTTTKTSCIILLCFCINGSLCKWELPVDATCSPLPVHPILI